jgi:hypothetical protein
MIPILNNFCTPNPLDALSFYVYEARFDLANSIAKQPYGT